MRKEKEKAYTWNWTQLWNKYNYFNNVAFWSKMNVSIHRLKSKVSITYWRPWVWKNHYGWRMEANWWFFRTSEAFIMYVFLSFPCFPPVISTPFPPFSPSPTPLLPPLIPSLPNYFQLITCSLSLEQSGLLLQNKIQLQNGETSPMTHFSDACLKSFRKRVLVSMFPNMII